MADESLFASRSQQRSRDRSRTGTHIVQNVPSAPTVVSASYIADIKTRAFGPASHGAAPHSSATAKELRKTRMLEADEHKRQLAESHALDIDRNEVAARLEHERQSNPAMAAARSAAVEEFDELKAFNLKISRALDQVTLQRQAEERKRQEQKALRREAAIHHQSQAELKKAVEEERRRQAEERAANKRYAEEISAQLEEREFNRMLAAEAEQQEGRLMVAAIERAEAEERAKLLAQREEAKAMIAEVTRANEQAQERKKELARREARKDAALLAYQAQKEREEQARLEEEERIKQERERLFAKMRAEQERAMDRRSEEDEARARRHQEARILAERAEQQAREAERAEIMREVHAVREQQIQAKAAKRIVEAQRDLVSVEYLQRHAKAEAAREIIVEEEKQHAALANSILVKQQIENKRSTREAERKNLFKEKTQIAREEALRQMSIDDAKAAKLKQLRAAGVPEEVIIGCGLLK